MLLPPQTMLYVLINPSLDFRASNLYFDRALVKIVCTLVGAWTSLLLVYEMSAYLHMLGTIWCTKFFGMLKAHWLTKNNLTWFSKIMFSFENPFNHIPLPIPWAMVSNYALLLVTTNSILELWQDLPAHKFNIEK